MENVDVIYHLAAVVGAKQYVEDPVNDVPRLVPDLSKAEEILDYHPAVSLEEGLQRTIAWYRERAA